MWLERWVIVIGSLQREFLPSGWGCSAPTIWDYAFLFGSVGLFFFLFCLFLRFLPMISISELRDLLAEAAGRASGRVAGGHAMPVTATLRPARRVRLGRRPDRGGRARSAKPGYTRVEAFAPYPLPEAAEALGYRRSGVAFLVFIGGLVGGPRASSCSTGSRAIGYPLNVGGRPPNSWPMFIPITFELTVLTACVRRLPRGVRPLPTAAVPPPAVRRAAVRPRHHRRVLPLRRGGRPEVRPDRHPGVPAKPRTRPGSRRCPNDRRTLLLAALVAAAAGCQQKMAEQPSYRPYAAERGSSPTGCRPAGRRRASSRASGCAATTR